MYVKIDVILLFSESRKRGASFMPEIIDMVRKHNDYRDSVLNLQASENFLSEKAREALGSDMASRYSLEINGEEAYGGAKFSEEVLHSTEGLISQIYKSKYAEVRPIGGHIAAEVVLLSTVNRKDNILSIPEKFGGYTGYENGYLPQMSGINNYSIPYDGEKQEIKFSELEKLIRSTRPRALVLGQSFFVKHYDLKRVKELCEPNGTFLLYDGSHVMGLIGGEAFQKDAMKYCDILYGSTHKSFFGPQGGVILTDNEELYAEIGKNITWRAMDNFHPSRVAALGVAAEEMILHGKEYASLVTTNSRNLGKELSDREIGAKYSPWYSETHQVITDPDFIKQRGITMSRFSEMLEKNGMIIDREGRIGTSEISRYGFSGMDEIAELISRAMEGKDVKRDVLELKASLKRVY